MQLKKQKLFLCFLLLLMSMFYNLPILPQEFLYPVAATTKNGKTKIYVLHQKSINNVELLVWDPQTKVCSQGLLSTYTPASLKILPNGDGFSFIDDGRIRIKKFDKRSPKAIDIYEPLYDISQLNWIDEHNFYVSAKKNNKFCIFHIHENGLIKPILEDLQDLNLDLANCDFTGNYREDRNRENRDCEDRNCVNRDREDRNCVNHDCVGRDFMYPQKVGNSLFYIERVMREGDCKKEHVSYKIAKTVYPDLCLQMQNLLDKLEQTEDFDVKTKKIQEFTENLEMQKLAKQNCQYLADFKNSPIAFLSMISETEGFFIKHPENICKHDETVTFECFSINQECSGCDFENENKKSNSWTCENIFSFSVPAYLILEVPDFCLYESILPLLPKYYNGKIYYVNFDTNEQSLNIFSYNLHDNKTEKVFFVSQLSQVSQVTKTLQTSQLLFSPVFIENTIFCGGKIDYAESCPIKMWINEENCICMDLPKTLV